MSEEENGEDYQNVMFRWEKRSVLVQRKGRKTGA